MNVVNTYKEYVFNLYMKTYPNKDPDKVRILINKVIEDNIRDIPCETHNSTTHKRNSTTMLSMFDWIENRSPIITGNGTFFKQHEEYLAPTVSFLEKKKNKRSSIKDEMYKQTPGSIAYINLDLGQGNVKVIMNAEYGGSGTTLSPFFSIYIPPATTGTAKNITTTLICCLELVTGNKHKWMKFNNINELFDMINIVLTDTEERELIHDIYTVDQVAKELISRTNNVTVSDCEMLRNYLSSLSNDELTKLMLSFNAHLVLEKYLYNEVRQTSDYFISHKLDIERVSKITDKDEQKREVYISGYGAKPPEEIRNAVERICKIVSDNCVYNYLHNDAEVRATYSKRKIVCVTDTDSLMVQFANYIDAFQVHTSNFKESCILAGGLGMRLFVETIIPKFVKYVAMNCNIKDEYFRNKFVFKNEYFYAAMLLFKKKMYAASLLVQEGNPRNPHKLDVKGLSFKKRDAAEFIEPIMMHMYDAYVLNSDTIQIDKILDEFYQLRDKVREEMRTESSYYKVASVKDESAYNTATLPVQSRGSIVWNAILPDEEILPMDRVICIPLSWELLHQYEASDPRIQQMLEYNLRLDNKEKNPPYICLPESYKQIPNWVQPVIDIEYSLDKTLSPFKQILEAFNVVQPDTRGGVMPSRMLYI